MVITDFNLQALRTRAFKGFVQFQDPDNPSIFLRLKERQTMNVTFTYSRDPHYNDAGKKVLDPSGHSHSFNTVLKLTSDLLDTQYNESSDQKTISYWIFKNSIYDPIEILFITTLESRDGDFLQFKYTLDPQTFGPVTLGASGGTSDITIQGEVISIEEIVKASTPDA